MMKRVVLALTCALALSSFAANIARAGIYQWAWVNPSDPTQGKYQSTTLCPGGAGVNAAPSANLASLDLTQAYLIGANLKGARCWQNNQPATTLTNADLSGANLTNANFYSATMTNANLSGANLTNANFDHVTMTNANLSGANLTGTWFQSAVWTGANLTNANVRGTIFGGAVGLTAAAILPNGQLPGQGSDGS